MNAKINVLVSSNGAWGAGRIGMEQWIPILSWRKQGFHVTAAANCHRLSLTTDIAVTLQNLVNAKRSPTGPGGSSYGWQAPVITGAAKTNAPASLRFGSTVAGLGASERRPEGAWTDLSTNMDPASPGVGAGLSRPGYGFFLRDHRKKLCRGLRSRCRPVKRAVDGGDAEATEASQNKSVSPTILALSAWKHLPFVGIPDFR